MTSDELRERKRELLARKKYEQELQEQGKGDSFALFMVNEELLDVNAQLRALAPAGKGAKFGRKGRTVNSDYGARYNSGDRQQFIDWMRQESSFDEEIDAGRAAMRAVLQSGILSVTGRQRMIITMWSEGAEIKDIAELLQVNKSTVSRTLGRAKKNLQRIAERRLVIEKNREWDHLDVSDPEVGKVIMSALTPHQAVCFYLYYSEWLSMREISRLTGIDASSICRTVNRAVARITDLLGENIAVLDNVDALDEVVYAVYCGLQSMGEAVPENVRPRVPRLPSEPYIRRRSIEKQEPFLREKELMPVVKIRTKFKAVKRGRLRLDQHGKLYQQLHKLFDAEENTHEEESGDSWSHPMVRWLVKIFSMVISPKKSKSGGS